MTSTNNLPPDGVDPDHAAVLSESTTPAPPPNEAAEKERRAAIQAIMRDNNLRPMERRRSIQSLMDGRRRSSLVSFQRCSSIASRRDSMGMEIGAAKSAKIVQEDLSDLDDDDSTSAGQQRSSRKRAYEDPQSDGPVSSDLSKEASCSVRCLKADDQMEAESENGILGSNIAFDEDGNPCGDPKTFEANRPQCDHYARKCSIISPCCGMVFGCRLCHDDSNNLSPPIFKEDPSEEEEGCVIPRKIKLESQTRRKFARRGSMSSIMSTISEMGDDVHHSIDRFAIKEIICRECHTRQSSKTNECIKCGVKFGDYHCNICNLWMSSDERPYHCEECGFCRVGGRENFKHCKGCGMCIDATLFNNHNCKSGKYNANCPVCYEDLFSSRSATHEMPCGHNIHWHCFNTLASHDIRCPICKKTATHEDMSEVWHGLAMDIAMQPLPPDQARVVDSICNDCEGREQNRRWHYLGVQCRRCNSFNTSHTTTMFGVEADHFLNQLEFQQSQNAVIANLPFGPPPNFHHR